MHLFNDFPPYAPGIRAIFSQEPREVIVHTKLLDSLNARSVQSGQAYMGVDSEGFLFFGYLFELDSDDGALGYGTSGVRLDGDQFDILAYYRAYLMLCAVKAVNQKTVRTIVRLALDEEDDEQSNPEKQDVLTRHAADWERVRTQVPDNLAALCLLLRGAEIEVDAERIEDELRSGTLAWDPSFACLEIRSSEEQKSDNELLQDHWIILENFLDDAGDGYGGPYFAMRVRRKLIQLSKDDQNSSAKSMVGLALILAFLRVMREQIEEISEREEDANLLDYWKLAGQAYRSHLLAVASHMAWTGSHTQSWTEQLHAKAEESDPVLFSFFPFE